MRKPIYRFVAVLTFIAGSGIHLLWFSFISLPTDQPTISPPEIIGYLTPATEIRPMLGPDASPVPSTRYMILTRSEAQPSRTPIDESLIQHGCATLHISVDNARQIWLNRRERLGTLDNTHELEARISGIFQTMVSNGAVHPDLARQPELLAVLPPEERIYKTVIIEAAPSTSYGDVVKIMRAVQATGAHPIALQIGGLVDRSFSEE